METAKQDQYIEIGIGKERYALNIYDIHEIIKIQNITELPNSKPYVKGVINLRGKIVPIISLRNRFGIEEAPFTKTTRIIVVNHAAEMVGMVVDKVNQVTTFSDIQPPPASVSNLNGSFFKGIGRTEEGLVSVLELHKILDE
jgi:purine-binding chemotaxis protein CheW